MAQEPRTPVYRSGVAARLAGIPVETLRVWERRYGVVGPQLTPRGHRLYSAEDVGRLAVIRQLVDLGTAIGSIARRPLEELRGLLAAGRSAARGVASTRAGEARGLRVAVIGAALAQQLARDAASLEGVEIVASSATAADGPGAFRGVSADVLAVEMPALQADAPAQIDALVACVHARHAIVAYRFAPAAALSALREAGHVPVRAPLDLHQLRRLCGDDPTTASPGEVSAPAIADRPPAPRRFDDEALLHIARAITTVACECPRHVVELLISLGAFERYSAECANLSAADAALHRYLQDVTGAARAAFEQALVRIASAEGVPLPTERATPSP